MTLDTKDIAILRELQQNAKASVKEIAEKVHLSTTPVHERIKRMEQNWSDKTICYTCKP